MFSDMIEFTIISFFNSTIIFIDSVPQREAMNHSEKKIELQIRRLRLQFLIFLIHIFVHIVQPLGLLHCVSVWWVCMRKCLPHNTGPKELLKRIMMGVPWMCKWGNHYRLLSKLEVTHPTERSWSLLAITTRPECRSLQEIGPLYEPIG